MRASLLLFLGAAALTTISTDSIIPARADPAYTADKLIHIFVRDKLAAARRKTTTRAIHLQPDPAPTRVDLLVNFEFDSNKLTDGAKENLAQFAAALKDPSLEGTKFEIEGFTDATGTEQYNLGLSDRRANAVVAYLVSLGVDPATLKAHGFGKNKPRVPDPYSAENRRVETHLAE